MYNYEAMKAAGIEMWETRTDAVDRSVDLEEMLDKLLDDCLNGRYQTDFVKMNAKALVKRLINEVYDCGVSVGFTYSIPEYLAWRKMHEEDW